MESFASTSDLEVRWRTLTADESGRAEVLLEDASAILGSMLAKSGVVINQDDELQESNLKLVCCAMVRRSMSVGDEMAGVTQYSETAGPFSGSATFSNPNGDMYVTSSEQKLLGLKRQRVWSIRPKIGIADDSW